MSGPAAEVVPVFGAIAIAGLTQAAMAKRAAQINARRTSLSMSQQLEAFNTHAIVNIVDHNNIITEVNDQLLQLTGYNREQLIGKPVQHLYDPASQDLTAEIRGTLVRGEIWQGETPLRRADGSTFHTKATIMPLIDASGKWVGSISARTDVTQTNQLIAEQHTAQTLYELRDDIWIIDSETETFSYLNRSATTRLGWNGDPRSNRSLCEIERDEGAARIVQACRALKESGGRSTHLETEFMKIPAHVSIKFVTGADKSERYLVVISDISDRIEQDRRKSSFVSTVSHELRSPLTSIKGAMGLLLSGSAGEIPEKALGLLEIAHRNADRLILILNDILDLEKISNGQMDFDMKDVDLADLVREADQANSLLQQRFGVTVEVLGTESPVPFRTDPNRFMQVLTNFLSNAYKFSKPNDRILIIVKREEGQVRVSVMDEGAGIPVDDRYKIFERFADLSNSDRASKGGTGLGLNICKTIIENLGGTIGFDTSEGIGSTFYFILPDPAIAVEATDDKVLQSSAS
ncbi:MAG: PAS domain-containing sensor histidine kinase [Sulfitobacter sp.]